MNGIYLLMGSNLGHRLDNLRTAAKLLSSSPIDIIEESSIYETEPWGPKNQGWFLNVLLEINTSKPPHKLLENLLNIENQLGRVRKEKWGERSIDIDILYYDAEIIETDHLTIPHPGIPERKFTLLPLVEVAPLEVHPTLNKNHVKLLAECSDPLDCKLTDYKL